VQIPVCFRVQLDTSKLLTAAFALSVACSACGQTPPEAVDSDAVSDKVAPSIRAELSLNLEKDLLVMLAAPAKDGDANVQGTGQALANDLDQIPRDEARAIADDLVEERAELYANLQTKVLRAVEGNDALELRIRYTNIPFLFMHVKTREALEALAGQPEVVRIFENTQFEHTLAQSLPLIHQPEAAAAEKLGANTAVAVIDTGCDYARTAFGTCSTPGAAGCKVAYAADFATNDNAKDENGHGTNVSAIVLGVAPSTKILALDVFNGGSAPGSAILAAIDWTISNRAIYNIVAMNLSLGSGSFSSLCGSDYFATALANARSAGILAAVASGNNGFTGSLASPACVPAAISVGAVYDSNVGGLTYGSCADATTAADKITCFSNSASFLSVLAPGAPITAGGLTMTGTSQASPHVAGALAVIRSAFPNEPLNAIVARITDTGTPITDTRNNVVKRRLDVLAALRGSSSGSADITPPTGSVVIAAGALAVKTGNVTLTISGSDASGVTQMCVSNTTVCTVFAAFATTKTWVLATGDGTKTVYVSLKDAAGNVAKVTDTIARDTVAPANVVLTATADNARVDLSWTAAIDLASGISSYKLVYATGAAPANCNVGTVAYSGGARTASHTAAVNGVQYFYRLCAIDGAGNLNTGVVANARPAPERNAPVGTVVIQAGAVYTRSTAVTLTLAATDASGVTTMCLSNTSTACTTFVAYTTTKTWTLSAAGTVYVWFRDAWGNVSVTPATDSIVVDGTAPTMGTFTVTPSIGRVVMTWSAARDAGSGMSAYKLVWAKAVTAPSCTAVANTLYSGTLAGYTHSGLTSGKYSYRLCAVDVAGNMSTGVTRTVSVQ
jgi:subtilisin family serine protease